MIDLNSLAIDVLNLLYDSGISIGEAVELLEACKIEILSAPVNIHEEIKRVPLTEAEIDSYRKNLERGE